MKYQTELSNYYGVVEVKEENGKFYWGLGDWNEEDNWREVSEELYNEILKHIGVTNG